MKDINITNAKVFTVDDHKPWAEAIAVRNGKIAAVGTNQEILGLNEAAGITEIDALGRLVLPGFIDSHCHPTAYTYKTNAVDLFPCTTIEDYQQVLKEYYEANPQLEVIKGVGWFYSDFPQGGPKKKDLDAVIADVPVMIYSGDLHSLWINSAALKMADINKDTENPYGGEFVKDDAGEPTGYINEAPAVRIIESKISGFSVEEFKKGVRNFFAQANESGITSIRDAGILDENGLPAYLSMDEEEFTVNLFCDCLISPDDFKTPEDITKIVQQYNQPGKEYFKCHSVKFFIDGVPEANTAVIEEEYLNDPGNCGEPQWRDLNAFNEACAFADKAGYQIHVHAIGDRAARYTVEALEYAANQNRSTGRRHMIAHLQLCSEETVAKMSALGAIAIPTAFWFEKGDMYYNVEIFNLGKERADNEYKMKSFMNAGIVVACGSDAPVGIGAPITKIPFAPVLAIQQGVTRCNALQDSDNPDNVLNPTERVGLEEMIKTYTINGAYANFAEDRIGSITVGKDADIIVLDQNLFEIPVGEIYKTNIDLTLLRGKIIYSSNA